MNFFSDKNESISTVVKSISKVLKINFHRGKNQFFPPVSRQTSVRATRAGCAYARAEVTLLFDWLAFAVNLVWWKLPCQLRVHLQVILLFDWLAFAVKFVWWAPWAAVPAYLVPNNNIGTESACTISMHELATKNLHVYR